LLFLNPATDIQVKSADSFSDTAGSIAIIIKSNSSGSISQYLIQYSLMTVASLDNAIFLNS